MVTLSAWVNSWIERRSIRLATQTISGYRTIHRKYIESSSVGQILIGDLTPEDLIVLLSPILALGYSRQAQLTQILINAALKDAARRRIIQWNPMESVDRIHHRKRETAWLSTDEAGKLLKCAKDAADPYYIAWILGFCCGLRRGELLGLKWSDIDFTASVMQIRRQRIRVDGKILETPPKSDSSIRDIPLSDFVIDALRDVRRIGAEYVVERDGKAATDKMLEAALDAAIDRAEVRRITLHGMRHTMAATAATTGIPIKTLQSILGHAQYTTTADIYAHVDRAAVISAAKAITDATIMGIGARLEIA